MHKLERIACLYLTFLNTSGISFARLRKQMPDAWEGEAESARRKFERDKDELRKLGLELQCYKIGDMLPDGNFANDYIYYASELLPQLPELHLADRELQLLAKLVFAAMDKKNPTLQLTIEEKQNLQSAAQKIFYQSPALLAKYTTDRNLQYKIIPRSSVQTDASKQWERFLGSIHKALQNKQKIFLTYRNQMNKNSSRRVVPKGLVARQSRWCLIAWCEQAKAIRSFYVDQITQLEILESKFIPDLTFKIDDYNLHPLSVSTHKILTIKLKFFSEHEDQLRDFLDGMPQNLKCKEQSSDSMEIETSNQEALFAWSITHPLVIQALGPAAVHKSYQDWIQATSDCYKKIVFDQSSV